jgi:hypothetical protein
MPVFLSIDLESKVIQSHSFIYTHSSPFVNVHQWEKSSLGVAEPRRIELGPALQQTGALPLSYAAY